ncbi:MAG: lactonase family protein [Alphaproteobacteria bacterium]|nr:lactonase family protein [Alphaproteobacteria bacterium]
MRLLIGTYATTIHALRLDPASGRLTQTAAVAGPENPSYLARHPKLPLLYAVSETRDATGQSGGGVTAWALDAAGVPAMLATLPSGGADPCHLRADPDGRMLAVANYTSGHITAIPLDAQGGFGTAQVIAHQGTSVHPIRQTVPHAHHVAWLPSPTGGRFWASDLGMDVIRPYCITPTGLERDGADATTPPGSGARRIITHPGGGFAYALGEIDATVIRYSIGTDGRLTQHEAISMLPDGYDGPRSGAEIRISPDGRHFYGSNRGQDSIARFAIAPDGRLSALGHTPCGGAKPRHIALSRDGVWLLACNQASDRVTSFRRDAETGDLTPAADIAIPRPACALFLPD